MNINLHVDNAQERVERQRQIQTEEAKTRKAAGGYGHEEGGGRTDVLAKAPRRLSRDRSSR